MCYLIDRQSFLLFNSFLKSIP